jgi:hypothetical protein
VLGILDVSVSELALCVRGVVDVAFQGVIWDGDFGLFVEALCSVL